ncbi:MAG: sigma-70 family RNA polymerase sigma factor [Candidatus Woesearchaeota archaeon]
MGGNIKYCHRLLGDRYDEAFFNAVCRFPLLSREEEKKLGALARSGDHEARQKMFFSNTRLLAKRAKSFAYKYRRPGLYATFFMDGIDGLYKAISRFDPARNCRFSTYATYWIDQAIRKSADLKLMISMPPYMAEWVNIFARAVREYKRTHYAEPSDDEVLFQIRQNGIKSMTLAQVRRIRKASDKARHLSLDNMLEIPDTNRPEESPADIISKGTLDEVISSTLDKREAAIIRLRYGLNGQQPMLLEQVGKILKLTKERVRQLQKNAVSRLRDALLKRGIP